MDQPPIQYARTSDGVNIAYTAEGRGPVRILLPHVESHQGLWRDVPGMSDLFRVGQGERTHVSLDQRGIGLSDRTVEHVSLETRVLDLQAVADAVEAEQFALIGTMASGPAAITYAHRHRERVSHLVLWNTYARAKDFFFGVERNAALGAVMQRDWEMFTEMSQAVAFGWGREEGRHYGAFFRASVTAEMYAKYGAGDVRSDVTDLLPEITVPTLVLLNEDVGHVTVEMARELAAGIPGAVLHTTPGTFLDDLDGIDAVIAGFLGTTTDYDDRKQEQGSVGGFQTILFTDLESSTALTQRLGDEGAQELLRGHNATVRAALEEHGGREVKHTGDGIMASFPSAVAAVTAALAMQRDLAGGEVRVRIGLNAGEPIAEEDDLFGLSVIIAARIGDRAEPGQVLVSNVVRELCAGKTFEFAPMGEATLKGFDEPVALYEVRV